MEQRDIVRDIKEKVCGLAHRRSFHIIPTTSPQRHRSLSTTIFRNRSMVFLFFFFGVRCRNLQYVARQILLNLTHPNTIIRANTSGPNTP